MQLQLSKSCEGRTEKNGKPSVSISIKQTLMKTTLYFTGIFLTFSMLFFSSCQKFKTTSNSFSDDLSDETKTKVTSEILELTQNWANAHNSMNADKAIELWDSSNDLMFAENGEFFPDRDSIYNYLKEFYKTTTSMNVEWKHRAVIPLSNNSASMSGNFKAHAVFKSGDVFNVDSKFTGVFVRKNGNWVLIHGHESFK